MTKASLEENKNGGEKEFTKRKDKQLGVLDKQIVSGKINKFIVFDHEAGIGKSLQAEKSMVNAWKNKKRKSLYVVFFKDSKDDNSCVKRINDYAGEEIAVAIDSDNVRDINKYIKYPVLIITHERYKILCKFEAVWRKYTRGRYNLIIDELPNMLEIYTYTLARMEQFENILPRGVVKAQYNKCVKELEDYIKEPNRKKFFNSIEDHSRDLEILKRLIDSNVSDEFASGKFIEFSNYNNGIVQRENMDKKKFLLEVEILRNFYSNTCCIDGNKAYAFDYRIRFRLLKNNMILDANANFLLFISLMLVYLKYKDKVG